MNSDPALYLVAIWRNRAFCYFVVLYISKLPIFIVFWFWSFFQCVFSVCPRGLAKMTSFDCRIPIFLFGLRFGNFVFIFFADYFWFSDAAKLPFFLIQFCIFGRKWATSFMFLLKTRISLIHRWNCWLPNCIIENEAVLRFILFVLLCFCSRMPDKRIILRFWYHNWGRRRLQIRKNYKVITFMMFLGKVMLLLIHFNLNINLSKI